MRIRLTKGKQKELIEEANKKLSWEQLSKKTSLSKNYIRIDLRNERTFISDETYKKLKSISGKDFDSFIIQKLEDNWGRAKGGKNSLGSTIKLIKPKKDEKLAEFVGAVLGDGNLNYYKKGKNVGVYQVKIAGDYIKDKEYHLYLKKLCENIFNLKINEILNPAKNERFLVIYSKQLIEFFISMGILPGDKIKNQSTVPKWIFNNEEYLKACLRGLIDTDGSIFRMSNKDFNLIRIGFTNHNKKLLEDTRTSFIKLNFNPSKVINNRQFHISRQEEIKRYIHEIGFKNPKHYSKLPKFGIALSSSGQI